MKIIFLLCCCPACRILNESHKSAAVTVRTITREEAKSIRNDGKLLFEHQDPKRN